MPRTGRPTTEPMTLRLQVRVSEETMKLIDHCAEKLNTNRSEIVRKGIEMVSAQTK